MAMTREQHQQIHQQITTLDAQLAPHVQAVRDDSTHPQGWSVNPQFLQAMLAILSQLLAAMGPTPHAQAVEAEIKKPQGGR